MSACHSLKLKALCFAAVIAFAGGSAVAGPPKGGNGGGNHSGGSMKMGGSQGNLHQGGQYNGAQMMKTMNHNNGQNYVKQNGQNYLKQNGQHNNNYHVQNKLQYNGNNHLYCHLQKPLYAHKCCVYSNAYCDPYYHLTCGVYNTYGYCYTGLNHTHWYCRKWSDLHGCYFFYDQGCCAWYYYCQPDCCYYPCTYMPYQTYAYVTPVVMTSPMPASGPTMGPTNGPAMSMPTNGPAMNMTGAPTVAANTQQAPKPAGGSPAPMQLPPLPGE